MVNNHIVMASNEAHLNIIIMQPCALTRLGLQRFFSHLLPQARIDGMASLAALSENAGIMSADLVVSDICDLEEDMLKGIEWLRWLQQMRGNKPLLIITRPRHSALLRRLAQTPSVSLITVQEAQAVLEAQLTHILCGTQVISKDMQEMLYGAKEPASNEALTQAEQRVLALLHEGHSVTYIATRLCRSIKTVSTQKRHIMRKLKVTSEVALFAQMEAEK